MNYINIHLKGLLANQMFCVSALFAYAWKHKLTPIVKSNQISRNHDTKAHRKLARINDKKQWKEMVERISVFKQMNKQQLLDHYEKIGDKHCK